MRRFVFWSFTIASVLAAIVVSLLYLPLKNARIHRQVEALGGEVETYTDYGGPYWDLVDAVYSAADCAWNATQSTID